METPQSKLHRLHQEHTKNLSQEELMNYLLDAQNYLKTEDLDGWMKNFAPISSRTEPSHVHYPPQKRAKRSDYAAVIKMMAPCNACKQECVIDDVAEGNAVCTACGTIQDMYALGVDCAHMSVDRMKNGHRHVVHRYSRVVYFKSFLDSIQGLTEPQVTQQVLDDLRLLLNGNENIGPHDVVKALRTLKISDRYRRHKYTLTEKLNTSYTPIKIQGPDYIKLLQCFLRIELAWNMHVKKSLKKRKAFLSYPYVFYQLCFHLNITHYTGKHHLLKDTRLLSHQHHLYRQVAAYCKLSCDLQVLNFNRE